MKHTWWLEHSDIARRYVEGATVSPVNLLYPAKLMSLRPDIEPASATLCRARKVLICFCGYKLYRVVHMRMCVQTVDVQSLCVHV